jgi:pimeloyl-ACP methyl ester carboxylesterase
MTQILPELQQVQLSHGPMHVALMGSGPAVVLLHQTPRSWDEYRDVIPLIAAAGYTAIAPDTPGFGASAPLPAATIETWAAAVHELLDALGIERATVVGHHTGGSIAVEVAATHPERVTALVLSSTSLTDELFRAAPPDESTVDAGEDAEALRASRAGFYPPDRPDLLDRYVRGALTAGPERSRAGHHVVAAYAMERALPRLTMPVLLIGATADPYAHPQLERFRAALPAAGVAEIEGGMVPLPDGWPGEFAGAILNFLASAESARLE